MLASAREQFKQGTPLFGKEGAFHRILEDFLNSALEELLQHLEAPPLDALHGKPLVAPMPQRDCKP